MDNNNYNKTAIDNNESIFDSGYTKPGNSYSHMFYKNGNYFYY
jgi:hypothetical protein